jgi:hypothetical protein
MSISNPKVTDRTVRQMATYQSVLPEFKDLTLFRAQIGMTVALVLIEFNQR